VSPSGPVYPALHSHAVFVVLPAGEVDAGVQLEQVPGPNSVLYVPEPHFEHVLPLSPVYPALHSQALFVMLPTGDIEAEGQYVHLFVDALTTSEYLPASQALHSADPVMFLYFPGTQAEQSSFVPVHPALQTHPATVELSAGENEFAGQSVQLPLSTPYVPGLQIHLPDTGTVETEP